MGPESSFAVGDKVVHPRYGAGQISSMDHLELVEGFEDYYVIEIPEKRLAVRVPVGKMKEFAVRAVMTQDEVKSVLNLLAARPQPLPEEADAREESLRERLNQGEAVEIGAIVRDLSWMQQLDQLKKADTDLLERARELLVSEIALATGRTPEDVALAVNASLERSREGLLDVEEQE